MVEIHLIYTKRPLTDDPHSAIGTQKTQEGWCRLAAQIVTTGGVLLAATERTGTVRRTGRGLPITCERHDVASAHSPLRAKL